MMTIPKPDVHYDDRSKIPSPTTPDKNERICFSFEALETNEYFNLDATCANWSAELFEMLRIVSSAKKAELMSGRFRNYRVHSHEKANPPTKLPQGVELKDCYQIRISKSKGGIHGVFSANVFYVIWLDPLHNMYPDDRYGGVKKIKPPTTCCRDREQQIDELQVELEKAKEDLQFFQEYYNEFDKS